MWYGESSDAVSLDQTGLQGSNLSHFAFDSTTLLDNQIRYAHKFTNSDVADRTIGEVAISNSVTNDGAIARFLLGSGQPVVVPPTYKLDVTWTLRFGAAV
jgi:hypothetical protein